MRNVILILSMAGVILFGGCKKNNTEVPLHDTVYTWGLDNITQIWPADNVRASADSASVRHVILQVDGKPWGEAFNEEQIVQYYINPIIEAVGENSHKLRGAGVFVDVEERKPEAHKWLENFGYSFSQTRTAHSR